jgi:fumarate reductase flavoprotein subunit
MYDIIIIGAGSAGMMCALRASERNKKVLVIEKSDYVGGTLHITAGHLSAGGTKIQLAKGIEDSPEKHYADVMSISHGTANTEIVKLATEKAPELINWLEENGYVFDQNCPTIIHGHVPYSIPRTHFGGADYAGKTINGAGTAVLDVILPIWEKEIIRGNIELLLAHKLIGFVRTLSKIDTVIVENVEFKKRIEVKQAKVVVTTGGYAANHQFFKTVHPDSPRLITTAKESSMGEGHQSIIEIGGQFVGSDKHSSTLGGIELNPNSGKTDFWKVWARVSNAYDRKYISILTEIVL